MPFAARMSGVLKLSLSAGPSQPLGAVPVPSAMADTMSPTSARSSSSDWALSSTELCAAMPHPLPAEIVARLDNARVLLADLRIERDGALDPVALHHLHHAPYADAHPEIAPTNS